MDTQPTDTEQKPKVTDDTIKSVVQPPVPEHGEHKLKPLPIILIVVAALVVLGIIASVIISFAGVSKKDYGDAVNQYNVVTRENSLLNTRVSSLSLASSGSDASFNSAIKNTEDSINVIRVENKNLGDMRAVKKGDAVPLYKTFNDKLTVYLAYSDDLVSSLKIARPAIVTCNEADDASDNTARTAALKKCTSELTALKETPNEEFNTYLNSLKTAYATYTKDFEALTQISDPYGAQYEQYMQLRDEVYATQSDVQKATAQFKTATTEHNERISVKASADALSSFLQQKQR